MNSRSDVLARVRGCFVGSLSGAVSIAAHGVGGGGMPPSEASVVLVLAACAVVGACVAAVRIERRQWLYLATGLAAGQVIGHATLAAASDHAHGARLSAPMIAAHIAAIAVAAVLIRAAEGACALALATLARIAAIVLVPARADAPLWASTPVYRAKLSLWLMVSAAAGTRGPPASV